MTEYTYDANGNMTSDRNRGITSITYNMLNLPRLVTFADGHEVLYTYAADGRKLRTEYRLNNFIVVDADGGEMEMDDGTAMGEDLGGNMLGDASGIISGGTTDGASDFLTPYTTLMVRDYCGSYIYRNDTIERVLTENGYIQNGELYFYVRDYQGNVRVVLDHNSQPVEENSYYPYGGLMAATSTEGTQPYKYGGKELDRENGLDLYDSQARWYDPMLARTTTMDPLAEKYYSISPYAWCAGNPVKFIDPTGMFLNAEDNYDGAARNLAQIAATSFGYKIINSIIDYQYLTIILETCFWTINSEFNPDTRTVLYPATVLIYIYSYTFSLKRI